MAHAHVIMARIRVVTDVLGEHGTQQHFHLFGVDIGGLTLFPLLYTDPVKHLVGSR